MDESQGSGGAALPPFLTKTYEMVDDPVTNSLVCWSGTGYSFIIWNPPDFSRDLLPRYFKHSNFSSFVRQLNTYGFRKIDPDKWEFANEEFIRGQKHLLKNIHRRKPIHSHSLNPQVKSGIPLTDIERKEFGEELERLNQDKSRLQLQLQSYQKENHEFQFQIRLLSERFQSMENRQRQVMIIMAQLVNQPNLLSVLKEKSEFHNKKRKSLSSNPLFHDFNTEEHHIGAPSGSLLNLEQIEKLDSSIKCWETLFYGIGETMGENVYDIDISSRPTQIVVTEMQTSSGNCDIDGQLCSPSSHPCSPPYSTDINSSPDLPVSVSVYHPDSPIPSFHHIDDIDPKSHDRLPETEASPELAVDHPVPGKINDVFWEQFLTEAPNISDTQATGGKISNN